MAISLRINGTPEHRQSVPAPGGRLTKNSPDRGACRGQGLPSFPSVALGEERDGHQRRGRAGVPD